MLGEVNTTSRTLLHCFVCHKQIKKIQIVHKYFANLVFVGGLFHRDPNESFAITSLLRPRLFYCILRGLDPGQPLSHMTFDLLT